MPSVSPSVWCAVLLPQPAAVRPVRARAASRRRRARPVMRGGILSPGHGRALAAPAVLLEDAAQASHRLGVLALDPPAGAQRLEDAVRDQLGLGLEGELDARRVTRPGLEGVDAPRADAVVLAAVALLDDAVGRVED